MTKILWCLPLLFMAFAADAQISKGAIFLGGQLSYASRKNAPSISNPQPNSYRSGAYNVSIGKAVKDNAVFGLSLAYTASRNENVNFNPPTSYKRNIRVYNAGIFYRKYKQLHGKFFAFVEGDLAYVHLHQTDNSYQPPNKEVYTETGGNLSIMPGISYNLFRKFQVELNLPNLLAVGYNHTSLPDNYFNFNTGLQRTSLGSLGIGFHFIL